MAGKQRFGYSYRKRNLSYKVKSSRSLTYFDYLRTLTDEQLRNEYHMIYSHKNDSHRKIILNQFLLENDKMDIIG